MKIKIIIILSFLFGFGAEVLAQDPNYETIFTKRANKSTRPVKGYGRFFGDFTFLNKNQTNFTFYSLGFDAGIVYKKKQSFGIFSQSLLYFPNSFRPNSVVLPSRIISNNLSGITYTYRHKPENSLHLAYNIRIGDSSVYEFELDDDSDYNALIGSGWILNPNIVLESNLMPWLRLNVEGGYTFTNGTNFNDINIRKDMRGPSLKIGLTFGKIR